MTGPANYEPNLTTYPTPNRENVKNELRLVDCVVLPSYREGTPRCLLEAASMGKPIITSNAVGCREVVDNGENGYLCKVRDSNDLELLERTIYPKCAN